jgi:hypothetical protein
MTNSVDPVGPVTGAAALGPDDLAEAATMLRRLLTLVEDGELEATTPNARAVLRRLEGATVAVELATGLWPAERSKDGR